MSTPDQGRLDIEAILNDLYASEINAHLRIRSAVLPSFSSSTSCGAARASRKTHQPCPTS
jgi:hypothetical protein